MEYNDVSKENKAPYLATTLHDPFHGSQICVRGINPEPNVSSNSRFFARDYHSKRPHSVLHNQRSDYNINRGARMNAYDRFHRENDPVDISYARCKYFPPPHEHRSKIQASSNYSSNSRVKSEYPLYSYQKEKQTNGTTFTSGTSFKIIDFPHSSLNHSYLEKDNQGIGEKDFGTKIADTLVTYNNVIPSSLGGMEHIIPKFPYDNEDNKNVVHASQKIGIAGCKSILNLRTGIHSNEKYSSYVSSSPSTLSTIADENNKENKKPHLLKADMSKLYLLCAASEKLREQLEDTKSCSCPRSRCIKLYCECFQAGRKCSPDKCSCKKCKNTDFESGPGGARTIAIQNILARSPHAFQKNKPSSKSNGIVCRCVKSQCLKLYCECFQTGKICSKYCLCVGCLNNEKESGPTGRRSLARHVCLQRNPDAFVKKVKKIGQGCSCKNSRCLKKYCDCFSSGISCSNKCSCTDCANIGVGVMKTHIHQSVLNHNVQEN